MESSFLQAFENGPRSSRRGTAARGRAFFELRIYKEPPIRITAEVEMMQSGESEIFTKQASAGIFIASRDRIAAAEPHLHAGVR